MKGEQPKPADEMRMSSKEFDRIMGKALQVKPQTVRKPKPPAKTKAVQKKRNARD